MVNLGIGWRIKMGIHHCYTLVRVVLVGVGLPVHVHQQ